MVLHEIPSPSRLLRCPPGHDLSLLPPIKSSRRRSRNSKRLGYYDGVVDGQMGSQTSAAIRRYQLAENLKVTGELNTQTAKASASPPPPPSPTTGPLRTSCRNTSPWLTSSKAAFISVGPQMQIAAIEQAQKKTCGSSAITAARSMASPADSLVRALRALAEQRRLPPNRAL